MTNESSHEALENSRFQRILVECLERLERGESLDGEALVREHPQFGEPLKEFLADQAMLKEVASGVRDSLGRSPIGRPTDLLCDETIESTPKAGSDFSAGETIRYVDEYEILNEIARGGMGVVFKARQQKLGRIVALKMILAGKLADDADVQRFHREAQAAANLKHPNIVPVHEIGEHEGRHYFTMDFVDGRSLAEEVREESLPARRAAELVRTVAETVQFAHDQGTVHRDLKPANVLLTADGAPHITDFGLAKMLGSVDEESRAELTASGQILGTPSYMSPEQASGKQELVGPASDIYSLGAILYACLTGRAPFVADSPVDTLLQVMKREPVSPRELNPSVPKDLETICLKCLPKEPHKRYGTAQELADDLNRFLEGRPVVARPVGAMNRTLRWCRRNPVVSSLLALVAVVLSAGAAISVYFAVAEHSQRLIADQATKTAESARDRLQDALETMELARDEAEQQRTLAVQRELETRDQLYVAHMNQAALALKNDNIGRVRQLLAQHVPDEGETDRREFEWYYLSRMVNSHELAMRTGQDRAHHVECSPDGRLIASCGETKVEIWDADSGDRIIELDVEPGYRGDIAFSPNGSRFVTGGFNRKLEIWDTESFGLLRTASTALGIREIDFHPNGTLVACRHHDGDTNQSSVSLIDIESGETVRTIIPQSQLFNICFRPDGRVLAASSEAREVYFWDVPTGRLRTSWPCPNLTWGLAYSPDGQRIALSAQERSVEIRDAQSGKQLQLWTPLPGVVGSLEFHPDGIRLLAGSEANVVHLFNTQSGEHLRDFRGHESKVVDVSFRPGTQQALTVSEGGWMKTWDTNRRLETVLPNKSDPSPNVAFSPNGRWMALGRGVPWQRDGVGHVELLDTQTRETVAVLDGHEGGVFGVAFRGDGRQLASAGADGRVILWDVETKQAIRSINASAPLHSLVISPDGSTVATGVKDGVLVWNMNEERLLRKLPLQGNRIDGLAISPDGGLLAACSGRRFAVWSLDGSVILEGAHASVGIGSGVAFSPDGTIFANANVERFELYDVATGRKRADVPAHSQRILSLEFLAGGQRLVTKSQFGEIKIWDLKTLQSLITLPTVDPNGWNGERLVASPDGKWIVAGQNSKELIIYSARSWTPNADPADPNYWAAVGRQQAKSKQWQSAFENFMRAYDHSRDRRVSVEAAACALLSGNEEAYRKIVREGVAEASTSDEATDVTAGGQLARLATHRQGVVEDTKLLFELARRSWQQNRPGPALLYVLLRMGDDEELLLKSEELLRRGGNERVSALLFRAIALYRLGRVSEANDSLAAGMRLVERIYVRSSPGRLPIQFNMHASLQALLREADRVAIEALDTAIHETPDDVTLLTARGNIHRRWRRWDAAKADFRQAANLQPDSMQSLKAAVATALLAGDTDARLEQDCEAIRELVKKPQWSRDSWSAGRIVALAPRPIHDEQLLNAVLAQANGWWGKIAAVALLHRMSRTNEALQLLDAVTPQSRDWRTQALTDLWRCLLLESLARDDEARKAFEAAEMLIEERLLGPGLTTEADEVMLLRQQAQDVLERNEDGGDEENRVKHRYEHFDID